MITTRYRRRALLVPAAWFLLLPVVSMGQTQTEAASLDSVRMVAGESSVLTWPAPNDRLASITSVTTSPPMTFPPRAELVDADGSPGIRLILPPAAPAGDYRVELAGRSRDGRTVAATTNLTVNAITFPKPSNGRNPVILLNGFQLVCLDSDSSLAASADTFGQMASLLQGDGAPVAFFNNCFYGDIRIEDLAVQLKNYIAGLTYADGSAVTQVDIVAHSMGGLVARAYLAGLQSDGSLLPPQNPKVGKLVLIAPPDFGSFQATRVGVQAPEMVPGSSFLWNLARWNQGQDDLRGVDAIAVIGDAGYYYSTGNFDDGVVSLTSGSLSFTRSDQRTRVLPYCHITPGISTLGGTVGMACSGAHGIADIDNPSHMTAQIVRSFLTGTTAWTTVGQSPSQQSWWSPYGGIYTDLENTAGTQLSDLTNVSLGSVNLQNGGSASSIYYSEFINGTGLLQFTSASLGTVSCGNVTMPAGYYIIVRCKYGPLITSVAPLVANVSGRVVRAGTIITVNGSGFGQQCASCQVLVNPGKVSLSVSSWTDQAITASLPASLTGTLQLVVQAAGGGSDAITIMAAASPTILLSNSQLQFSYSAGGSLPPSEFVSVSNAGGGTLTWSAAPNASWITASATPSTLTVSVNPNGLTAGSHQGSISITTAGASNSPQTVSVTLAITALAQGPVINTVANAFGGSSTMAPNTWVIVQGSTLAQTSRTWAGSDFVGNRMPVALDGVSVTMNGQPTYVYYVSPAQLNILTPPDLGLGPVQVQVTNNGVVSAAFTVQAQQYSPSFFVFDASHVTGTHADGSLLGPTSLYPGYSTPANPNETVILYANGLGPTSSPVVSGAVGQSGSLPVLPVLKIGGLAATVQYAGLASPGLYQLNVVVPAAAQSGDNTLTATYQGLTTQSGVIIAVAVPPAQLTVRSVTISPTSVTGGSSATGTVQLSGSAQTGGALVTLRSSGTAATVPASVSVAAGASVGTFTVTTSAVTASQTITVTATLGSSSQTATLTVNPPVQTSPDLVVTSVSFPTSAAIGSTQTFTAVVRNNGTAAAGVFRVALYYSTDSTIDTRDTYVGQCNFSSMAAGSSAICSVQVPVPTTLSAGTYWGGAIADDLNQVAETNHSDNALATSTTVSVTQAASPWSTAYYTLDGILSVDGQTVHVQISSNNSFGTYIGQVISLDATSPITVVISFDKSATASGNTITYTGVESGVSNYVNFSRSANIEPITQATMTLTLSSAGAGSAVNGTINFTTTARTLTGTFKGTVLSID